HARRELALGRHRRLGERVRPSPRRVHRRGGRRLPPEALSPRPPARDPVSASRSRARVRGARDRCPRGGPGRALLPVAGRPGPAPRAGAAGQRPASSPSRGAAGGEGRAGRTPPPGTPRARAQLSGEEALSVPGRRAARRMSNHGGPRPAILVVDDTPANLGVLFELLDQAGYEVLVAEDGASALERAALARPDLILLDVLMPDLD